MGYILNGYWVKGFNLFDNLLGVLVCFRENRFVFIRDIKKMYYIVKISELDYYIYRFLWRDMDSIKELDIYIIKRVLFGDKSFGTMVIIVLRKTVEMTRNEYLEVVDIIENNIYMDDIIESKDNFVMVRK